MMKRSQNQGGDRPPEPAKAGTTKLARSGNTLKREQLARSRNTLLRSREANREQLTRSRNTLKREQQTGDTLKREQRTPELLGVTVCTPRYKALCVEAVKRVEKFLKIPVLVLECEDAAAFSEKMKLDMRCPSTRCVFFDADWWPVREMDFSGWDGTAWMAVHDPGVFHPMAFPVHDCPVLGLAPELYFNSGLFLWDNRRKEHRKVFQTARNLAHDIEAGKLAAIHDWGDQSLLNAGVQHGGVPLNLLPFSYNYMRFMLQGRSFLHTPALVHGVHAAGFPVKEKMRHLECAEEFLGYELDVSEHGEAAEGAALRFQHGRAVTLA